VRFVLDVLSYIICKKSVRLCGLADFFVFCGWLGWLVVIRGILGMGRGSVGVGL
jgi:hypothetical protein